MSATNLRTSLTELLWECILLILLGVSFEASFLCGMVRALGLLHEDCSRGLKMVEERIMIHGSVCCI